LKKKLIQFNNWLTRRKKFRLEARQVLLLCPRCLQRSECGQSIINDPFSCRECGECDVAAIVKLARETGVQLAFVTGGARALKLLRQPDIRAVVAVACELELVSGLLRSGRKPVLAVAISRPHGPCQDTRIAPAEIEKALSFFLRQ
jgi:hypothetical protein